MGKIAEIEQSFAENLRRCRKAAGMTQKQLAETLCYSEKAVSKWESGKGMPPAALLPALADRLQTDIDSLLREKCAIKYYLGIDGGGTKTEFVLTDEQGTVLARTVLAGSNPNDIGIAETLRILGEGIDIVCGDRPRRSISVFAGLSGGITGDAEIKIAEFLRRLRFGAASNESDARNAIAVGLKDTDGVAVILGTGSIAFAQCGGVRYRVGGYGNLFGDAGSGYSFGHDAILAALWHEEGSGTPTILTEMIQARCDKKTVLDSLSDFYIGGKKKIASFAPLVFEAQRRGDAVAEAIIQKNVADVADLIVRTARYLPEDMPTTVALCGGISVGDGSTLLPLIQDALSGQSRRKFRVRICTTAPVWGALYAAGLRIPEHE